MGGGACVLFGAGWILLRQIGGEALVEEHDGTLRLTRSAFANRSAAFACSPRSPRSVSGWPTTTSSTAWSRTIAAISSRSARATTPSGRAITPVGSETATPVRADP